MNTFILRQEDLLEHVYKAFTNYKKSPKDRISVSYIESRTESLEKCRNNFEEVHFKIIGSLGTAVNKSELPYFKDDVYMQFEDVYIEYKTRLKEDLSTLRNNAPTAASTSASTAAEIKLPQIQLPRFSGNYEEWQTFHDMFLSLIHKNKSLSAVQKLHYLKCSLYGEAELLLKNIATTETNYDEAWLQLTRRYTNKRFNCNQVMKVLFGQRNLSSESATSIKQLLDTTSACLNSLQNLKINTSSWDAIINHLVLTKLDAESRKLWELQVSQSELEELPTWKQLSKFLETRFRTLEMLDGGKFVNTSKPINHNSTTKSTTNKKAFHSTTSEETKNVKNNEKVCAMCEGAHAIYQCKQFEGQSPEERSDFVQSKGLCFNCLSANHSVKQCRQSMCCRRCGRRHHLMLHYERVKSQEIEKSSPREPTNQARVEPPVRNVPLNKEIEKRVAVHFAAESNESRVLLATAMVRVKSSNGHSLIVRALIDQGSEVSFVTEATTQSLGLKKSFVNGIVSGIGEGQTKTKSMVSVKVESCHNPNFSISINAFVLKN